MSSETIKPKTKQNKTKTKQDKTKQNKTKTKQDSQTRLLFSMPEVGEH
jgi:hypothetical protein